jgi:RNA polymerase sigma factor (TIGR02999 family)
MELVYRELRSIASRQRRRAPEVMTMDATGMVHEAFIRLVHYTNADWNDRGHFYAVATRAMRQVIVDYCRQRLAKKRGAGAIHEALDEAGVAAQHQAQSVLDVHEALDALEESDPKLVQVVECRFFAGLSEAETAEAMGTSLRSVQRYWSNAKRSLKQALTET